MKDFLVASTWVKPELKKGSIASETLLGGGVGADGESGS